jgi:hypothetical protein
MASNFPTSLDNFSNPTTGNKLDSPSHAGQHGDANDAVEALERKIGVGASTAGSATTGFPLVHSSGGTTAWAQVGYEGITSGTATSGQVLTAGTATGTAIWNTPTPSGLVQVIPTSIAVTGGSGSVGSNGAVNFTSVTSLSVNGCFNSTYDCYRLVLNLDPNATGYNSITGRLRTSGTDASGSNYSYYGMYVDSASGPTRDVATNGTSMSLADSHTGGGLTTIDIANPFVTKRTFFNITRNNATSANTGYQFFLVGGCHNVATSYDGLTLNFTYANSGILTIYGYKI